VDVWTKNLQTPCFLSTSADRNRHVPPLELAPFSEDWLAWYAGRRLRSEIDLLNCNLIGTYACATPDCPRVRWSSRWVWSG
jgi:hypothetical protein